MYRADNGVVPVNRLCCTGGITMQQIPTYEEAGPEVDDGGGKAVIDRSNAKTGTTV